VGIPLLSRFFGPRGHTNAENALNHLRELADFLRVLGCYPKGRSPETENVPSVPGFYFAVETVSPTLAGAGRKFADGRRLVHFVMTIEPTESSMLRITLPVLGSFTSRTMRRMSSRSPTLTPAFEPTLIMTVPSGSASATKR